MKIFEKFLIPILILIIILASVKDKKKPFDLFAEGAKEGVSTIFNLFPVLLALFLSVNMLRASGIINFMSDFLGNFFEIILIPKELTSLILLKPISGSSSMAIATEIISKYGPDSMIGLTASTILGATETALYTISIYAGAIKKKISKKLLLLAILGNFLGIFISSLVCRIIF